MADDIFGGGLDRHVHPMGERLEVERRRPGIVHYHHGAGFMRGLAIAGMSCTSKLCEPGDSVNTTRVVFLMRALIPAADQRVVIGGLDAEPLQHVVAEAPRRPIDAVGDEHIVAGRRRNASSVAAMAERPEGVSSVR